MVGGGGGWWWVVIGGGLSFVVAIISSRSIMIMIVSCADLNNRFLEILLSNIWEFTIAFIW